MSIARTNVLALFSCALLIAAALPAEAHRVWPLVGVHPGDLTVTETCKPGSYLSGFEGRAGLWLDAVQIICTDREGTLPQGDALGGTGGAPAIATCSNDRDKHIAAIKIDVTSDGKRIKNLILYCGAPAVALTRHAMVDNLAEDSHSRDKCMAYHPLEAGANGVEQAALETSRLHPVDGINQGADIIANNGKDCSMPPQEREMAQQECPLETFVGMTVRFGKDVNSIGFICDTDPLQ